MSLTGQAQFGYEVVSETYPAGGSLNEPMNFVVEAPDGMLVTGGGFHYRHGVHYSRPTADGSAWEVGLTGPTTDPLTVYAVCVGTPTPI